MRRLLNKQFKLDLILAILCALITIQFILPNLEANLSKNTNVPLSNAYKQELINSPTNTYKNIWKIKK